MRYRDPEIANVLNRLGRRTGKSKRWNQHRVATAARVSTGLPGVQATGGGEQTLILETNGFDSRKP